MSEGFGGPVFGGAIRRVGSTVDENTSALSDSGGTMAAGGAVVRSTDGTPFAGAGTLLTTQHSSLSTTCGAGLSLARPTQQGRLTTSPIMEQKT